MIGKYPQQLRDFIRNIFSNVLSYNLTYIVEGRPWSIQEDGQAITKCLNTQHLLRARTSTTHKGIRNQIIHFGSINTYFEGETPVEIHASNKVIVTWFHIKPDDPRVRTLVETQKSVHRIHTSCLSTKKQLIESGIDEKKIVVIPLGVDTQIFRPPTQQEHTALRSKLGIPENAFVIGSFQKDGEGWGEGMNPKHIKGPDILIETLATLKDLNLFVILTGPSRGYVKKELDRLDIPYHHEHLSSINDVANMYRVLDLYLITSRIEGGPKAILESWASGVPVVSTRVGMVPDIATNHHNVLLAHTEDVTALARHSRLVHNEPSIRSHTTHQGLKHAQDFTWNKIAKRYLDELYT
jgi:glycosyltransferase involved in cell wall biosynthesis